MNVTSFSRQFSSSATLLLLLHCLVNKLNNHYLNRFPFSRILHTLYLPCYKWKNQIINPNFHTTDKTEIKKYDNVLQSHTRKN